MNAVQLVTQSTEIQPYMQWKADIAITTEIRFQLKISARVCVAHFTKRQAALYLALQIQPCASAIPIHLPRVLLADGRMAQT